MVASDRDATQYMLDARQAPFVAAMVFAPPDKTFVSIPVTILAL